MTEPRVSQQAKCFVAEFCGYPYRHKHSKIETNPNKDVNRSKNTKIAYLELHFSEISQKTYFKKFTFFFDFGGKDTFEKQIIK